MSILPFMRLTGGYEPPSVEQNREEATLDLFGTVAS